MDKVIFDQAEGLRRMLASAQPRFFTILSATSPQEKGSLLANLGASLSHAGKSVLLLDARMDSSGVASHLGLMPNATLMQVAGGGKALHDAILPTPQGFAVSVLAVSGSRQSTVRQPKIAQRIEATIDLLTKKHDVFIVDATLDESDTLPLEILTEGTVIVQVSDTAESIKSAYSIIKRLNSALGRRPFSILVTGTTEDRAKVVFQNLEKVASRYLAVPLTSFGFVPNDDHVDIAARLGRSVIDAFPRAGASLAFRRLADSFVCGAGIAHNSRAVAAGTHSLMV